MSNDKRLKKDGMDTMSQVLKNFNRYRYLLGELAKKNIKLKYRRSYLGILWTLIEPLLTMIVLSVVFGNLLGRIGTGQGICRRSVSGLCTDRTTVVFLFLFLDE